MASMMSSDKLPLRVQTWQSSDLKVMSGAYSRFSKTVRTPPVATHQSLQVAGVFEGLEHFVP